MVTVGSAVDAGNPDGGEPRLQLLQVGSGNRDVIDSRIGGKELTDAHSAAPRIILDCTAPDYGLPGADKKPPADERRRPNLRANMTTQRGPVLRTPMNRFRAELRTARTSSPGIALLNRSTRTYFVLGLLRRFAAVGTRPTAITDTAGQGKQWSIRRHNGTSQSKTRN